MLPLYKFSITIGFPLNDNCLLGKAKQWPMLLKFSCSSHVPFSHWSYFSMGLPLSNAILYVLQLTNNILKTHSFFDEWGRGQNKIYTNKKGLLQQKINSHSICYFNLAAAASQTRVLQVLGIQTRLIETEFRLKTILSHYIRIII